jgi:A/G-specific adenine glycosylase
VTEPTRTEIRGLRRRLLASYRAGHRDLPWRKEREPYAIWISEIMCQQTQVETVIPRYAAFLDRFPDLQALARATESEVCEAWAGLGYYRRARNLHAAARLLVEEHDGRFPSAAAELQRLPGIGRYTAGAIASIAFGEPAPVVDGNVTRVLCRLFALGGDPSGGSTKRSLWSLAAALANGRSPGDVNQALMELGATVCTPRSPACSRCPVRAGCRARQAGDVERYPRARRAMERKQLDIAFAWVRGRAGVWLERRPIDGLWAGLWELPSAAGQRARAVLSERLGVELAGPIARVEHELTHRAVRARIFEPVRAPRLRSGQNRRRWREPLLAPLSGLARKAILAAQSADPGA